MHQLEFTHVYDYSGEDESVILPVVLRSGPKQLRVAASVDTGASFCLFGAEIAEALGLDLEGGIRKRFRTANSGFDAFGHEVELSVFGVADPMIEKNVLGRIGWLDRVRFGLVHHDNKAYLAQYDQG
jgi:hypothetical protein